MSSASDAASQALQHGLARVIAHYNAGRRGEAEGGCRALLVRDGPHAALLQMLAVLCHERGDATAARTHIDASLATRPDHPPSLMIQALICQDLQDLGAAEASLCRVLAVQPQHPAAALNLGIIHLQQRRLDDALARLGLAWRKRPASLGRIAMALCSERSGALWLDGEALKTALAAAADAADAAAAAQARP
jgi:tetratricopeptide (TPR) repeat protein